MLQPQLYSLSKLLNENLFIIPPYQRSYSWQKKQRDALFADIDYLWNKKKTDPSADHFMSTLVCLKKPKPLTIGSTDFSQYDVVDGQQRLTTLIILLKNIELVLQKGKDKQDLADILVKQDKSTTPILLVNHDEKRIFKEFIVRGTIPKKRKQEQLSDQMLIDAIYECAEYVKKWMKSEPIEKLYALLKNNLYFILHTMDQESVVYKTFEVLNSRGLPVEWLDRLKCQMMGILFEENATDEQISEMHQIWSSIYKEMGLEQELGEMAMRFLALLKNENNSIKSEEESALELYDLCKGNAIEVLNISRELDILVKDLKQLKKNVISNVLLKVQHSRFLALCIHKSGFTTQQKKKLMEAWEKTTFRIFGLERKDSRFYKGDFIALGKKIYSKKIDFKTAFKEIQKLSSNCNINKAVEELKNLDIYHNWADEFKYIMYQREIELAGSKNRMAAKTWKEIWLTSATDSIEHVMSQTSKNAVDSFRDEKRNKIFKHRLGNLLIIDEKKNSSLHKLTEAKDKVGFYNDLFIEKEVAQIIQGKRWNKKTIKEREDALCAWMIKKWSN